MFGLNVPTKLICAASFAITMTGPVQAADARVIFFDTFHACLAAYRGAKTAGDYLVSKGYTYKRARNYYVIDLPSKNGADLVVRMNPRVRGKTRLGCIIQTKAGGELFDVMNAQLVDAFKANKVIAKQAGRGTYFFEFAGIKNSVGMKVTSSANSAPLTTMDLTHN